MTRQNKITRMWQGVLLGTTVLASIIGMLFYLRIHGRKVMRAAETWRHRQPMSDEGFLTLCQIPDEPLAIKVALTARSAIAQLADVPPATILPDDSFDTDLGRLPFWDSPDFLGFLIECERQLEDEVVFRDQSWADQASQEAGGPHVVRAMALWAIRQEGRRDGVR